MPNPILPAVAATLAIAVVAPAAQAQDRDSYDYREGYRRGYDDGYAAGYRRALEEGSRPPVVIAPTPQPVPVQPVTPRPTGPIAITRAVYGSSSRSCDATRFVSRQANGRLTANVGVTNEMCGDPAPGSRKQLEVTYTCGRIVREASAYEHRSVFLDCAN